MRPWGFGIDVVGRHRTDATPIIDAGVYQPLQQPGAEVGRRLYADIARHDQTRGRDGP